MTAKAPQTAWKTYTVKELCAHFDLSTQELADFAAAGLILAPAARHKGPPYTEMDFLRLGVFKRCIQAGYGLDEVLDLIGRIHRRTAPIKTVILAKAFASDKLSDLENQMADGDALTQVNLRCDADILRSYIDDLARMQRHMGATPDRTEQAASAPPPLSPPEAPTAPTHRPKTPVPKSPPPKVPVRAKPRTKTKHAYPRTYGSLAEDSRQLWKRATPGGRLGWAAVLIIALVAVGGYFYYAPSTIVEQLSTTPDSATTEEPLEVETMGSEAAQAGNETPQPVTTAESVKTPQASAAPAPPKKAPTAQKPKAQKAASLTETAASDLEKIMATSGETAAASGDAPQMIRINELVVFYDAQTRVLRVKIELLKNLVANAPTAVNGRIFVTLRPVGDDDPQGIITVPRIPLSAQKMADFSKHGVAFNLVDQKTSYIKTQLSKQPPLQQELAIYIFDNQQQLLLRETASIRIKVV